MCKEMRIVKQSKFPAGACYISYVSVQTAMAIPSCLPKVEKLVEGSYGVRRTQELSIQISAYRLLQNRFVRWPLEVLLTWPSKSYNEQVFEEPEFIELSF